MAREGFIGSLGLLVLLCSVSRSTQQLQDKQGNVLGHPRPVWTTTRAPPPPPPPPNDCKYQDQIIYERDIYGECLVCVCVQRPYGYLDTVCGRCDQCPAPSPLTPPTPPTPTTTTPTPPTPAPLPTCDPFPTNKWFQNPIDPCLLCICTQPNPFIKPTIECVPNPQCVQPSTTHRPGPPPPDPWICDQYPHNVYFPHPQYACFICQCQQWPLQKVQLECVPDPACEPTPPPPPPPPPPPTTTLAPPTSPAPPVPWVDPLPGPGPHPSCRPFIPNMIFQHPWDSCLECVCTESHIVGIINVQVSCFTKAECCILPVDPSTTPYYPPITTPFPIARPYNPGQIGSSANANAVVLGGDGSMDMPGSPGSSLAQADAAAEAAAQAQAAADAVQANFVNQYPYMQPSQMGGAQAQAQAVAQSQANQALAQALAEANVGANRAIPPSYYNPSRISPGGYSNANANANANAMVNSFYQQPYYPAMGGGEAQADSNAQAGWGSANAQADAIAQGNAQAQADAQAIGYGSSGWNPVQDALAQAQANVQNSLYAMPQQAPMMPYGYSGLGSSAQAQAEAEADAGRGSAQAAANAFAQELANQAQAQAGAQANVNSQLYQSQPSPVLFNVPRGPLVNPVDAPRYGGDAEAQAQAEASANSNRGAEAAAQAQASASAAALKSGDSDMDADSQY